MLSRTRQLAVELFNGIVGGELSLNMVTALIDGWLKEFVEAAIEHQINVVAEGKDTPAAEPPVSQAPTAVQSPPGKRRVDFETGRVTHKHKRRGMVWIKPVKAPDGTIRRRGYYVSKRKLGKNKGKKGITRPSRQIAAKHGMTKREWDMFKYFTKKFNQMGWEFTGTTLQQAREFNAQHRAGEKAVDPALEEKRARSRLAFYQTRARKHGWPIPQTAEEGAAQNSIKSLYTPLAETPPTDNDNGKRKEAVAARIWQPHKTKARKTFRKKRRLAKQTTT